MKLKALVPIALSLFISACDLNGMSNELPSETRTTSFTWDIPTTRIDGTALSKNEIAVFVLSVICTGNENTDDEYRVTTNEYSKDILVGTNCTALVAVEDTDGRISKYSDELNVRITN